MQVRQSVDKLRQTVRHDLYSEEVLSMKVSSVNVIHIYTQPGAATKNATIAHLVGIEPRTLGFRLTLTIKFKLEKLFKCI